MSSDVALVSLLLTRNILDTFLLSTLNMEMADGILYWFNLNLFNLIIFCQKELHLNFWIGLELNILTYIGGQPL